MRSLNRSRTSTPSTRNRSRNSPKLPEPAAAVRTERRSVSRTGSRSPRRSAFAISAYVGRYAAVRSLAAVTESPYFSSTARDASPARQKSFRGNTRRPSCRTRVATTWMWSSACRTSQ